MARMKMQERQSLLFEHDEWDLRCDRAWVLLIIILLYSDKHGYMLPEEYSYERICQLTLSSQKHIDRIRANMRIGKGGLKFPFQIN